jgi:hypothetical protein
MTEKAKTQVDEAETNVQMLVPSKPSDPLAAVIVKIQKAQMILKEPDNDGLRDSMVEPVLRLAISGLTEVYQQYKARRKAKS